MLDFDNFINKPCVEIFGREATYIPANNDFDSFVIKGDFHKDYKGVKADSSEVEISSNEIVLFVRDVAMPPEYSKANQGARSPKFNTLSPFLNWSKNRI